MRFFSFCKEPFSEYDSYQVKEKATSGVNMAALLDFDDVPQGIQTIIHRCLSFDKAKRPVFSEIDAELQKIEDYSWKHS